MAIPTKIIRSAKAYAGAETKLQFGTDWGSETTGNRTAGQFVGPFQIVSGTHKVTTDTIESRTVKILECVGTGAVFINSAHVRQLPAAAAYGTWDFWFSKSAVTTPRVLINASIGANWNDAAQNGYNLLLLAGGTIYMQEIAGGATSTKFKSPAGSFDSGWNRFRITRSAGDVFSTYLNGTLVTAETLTNPFTDSTVQVSKYFVLSLGTGDKIALADVTAGHAINKFQGVIAP